MINRVNSYDNALETLFAIAQGHKHHETPILHASHFIILKKALQFIFVSIHVLIQYCTSKCCRNTGDGHIMCHD